MNFHDRPDIDGLHDMTLHLVRKHQLAVEGLTEQQFAEAIRQAIPDFHRYVMKDRQAIVYLPGSEAHRWKTLYHELIHEVESVHEGESRHQIALRYIREREQNTSQEVDAL